MLCPLALVQKPLEGFFDRDDLQWVSRRLQVGNNKGEETSTYQPIDSTSFIMVSHPVKAAHMPLQSMDC